MLFLAVRGAQNLRRQGWRVWRAFTSAYCLLSSCWHSSACCLGMYVYSKFWRRIWSARMERNLYGKSRLDSCGRHCFENDFVDSGHIRLGVLNSPTISLNAKKMEVLDHKVGSGKVDIEEKADVDKYSAYLSKYTNLEMNTVVKIFVQNENLTVDIPNKATLPFN